MSGKSRIVAYAAIGWATLFAAAHFYWGAGGCLGFDTRSCEAGFRNPYFSTFNLISGVLCLLGAFFVLALILYDRFSKALSVLVLVGGALLTLRGVAGLVQDAFIIVDSGLRLTMIYDPWFLLGGILFLSVWRQQRRTKDSYVSS